MRASGRINLPLYLQQPPPPPAAFSTCVFSYQPPPVGRKKTSQCVRERGHVYASVHMEGDGGAGASATAWDLGMHWAPAAGNSAYPQHFLPPPPPPPGLGGPSQRELTGLKLGKRPCCLAGSGGAHQVAQGGACHVNVHGGAAAAAEGKRKEKTSAVAVVARCQVEGCHLALAAAKEYHRRHKVCEAHSKAPRVVVHGAEQRFCQQCSRFHAISEFDDAKRSCRRRLAGHNERRRKSNASEAMVRSSAHQHGSLVHGFPPYSTLPMSTAGALSLLSSARSGAAAPWLIPAPADMFTARSSSAALDELIAENRAALLACHFFPDRSPGQVPAGVWHAAPPGHAHAGRHQAPPSGHVTLDLMQAPTTAAFRPTPDRAASSAEDGDVGRGPDGWAPLEAGAHAV